MIWECKKPGEWLSNAGYWVKQTKRLTTQRYWGVWDGEKQLFEALPNFEMAKQEAEKHHKAKKAVPKATLEPLPHVTRVEVIDHRTGTMTRGRAFTAWDVPDVKIAYQDDGRTLKVFLK